MTERLAFQYLVLRCVPRVEREEFVNVGVVLYCQSADFLATACHLDAARIQAVSAEIDLESVRSSLNWVEAVCRGEGPAAAASTDQRTRFGLLQAPRSTVIQPSRVHGGTTLDPAQELERLVDGLVR